MRKSMFVFAVLAASSSMAFAGEVKQTKTATTMSDAQTDKVTAGDAGGIQGHAYAFGQGIGPGYLYNLGKNAGPK